MRKTICLLATALLVLLVNIEVRAQPLPFGHALLPANPTSADNLKLSLARSCGRVTFPADAYRVSMSNNVITVRLAPYTSIIVPTCPPTPRVEVDIGRLPAGNYSLDVFQLGNASIPEEAVLSNVAVTITEARNLKLAPYVRLNYSGHWWDPNDSGWGLFIWHDASDHLLAAWFTYGTDGKPIWYVFDGLWQTPSATRDAPLLQTSRPPGPIVPPPNPTSVTSVGNARLDFTNLGTADEGKFIYTFTGGTTQERKIQRFKP